MNKVKSARERRIELIRNIENTRSSRVIVYFVGDRQGATAQIGEDAVRPMYEHVRSIAKSNNDRLDLFLYSRGGGVEVPWRIVSMFREYCKEFNILVPYKAHSAATLIALGVDNIVIGKKGELGPIDPQISSIRRGEGTNIREEMSAEDITSYITFIRDFVGIKSEDALASSLNILSEKLNPWILGSVYRASSHIRLIAQKLLKSGKKNLTEAQINQIVETLAKEIYFHGHAIGRSEAKEIGLPIIEPDEKLEGSMWDLYAEYESLMKLWLPLDHRALLPKDQDEYSEKVILATIESTDRLDLFRGDMTVKAIRVMPQSFNLNLNVNLALPQNIQPQQIPQAAQSAVQKAIQDLQANASQLLNQELKKQAPVQKIEGSLLNAYWQDATSETN